MLTVSVNNDGIIEATYGLDTRVEAGKVILADFINEFGLKILVTQDFNKQAKVVYPHFRSKRGNAGKNTSRFFRKIKHGYYRRNYFDA